MKELRVVTERIVHLMNDFSFRTSDVSSFTLQDSRAHKKVISGAKIVFSTGFKALCPDLFSKDKFDCCSFCLYRGRN